MRARSFIGVLATVRAVDGFSSAGFAALAKPGLWLGHSEAKFLHPGDNVLPPLVELPASLRGTELRAIVTPPSMDELWQWVEAQGLAADDDGPDPSWAKVWPTAAALSAHVAANPALVRDRRIAELGAGLGVVGLAAALSGAQRTLFLDREAHALHCAMASAALNGVATLPVGDRGTGAPAASAALFDWMTPIAPELAGSCDVILAADVLYDPSAVAPLFRAAAALIDPREGGRLLLADPAGGRAVGCQQRFLDEAAASAGAAQVIVEPLASVDLAEPLVLVKVVWAPRL